MVQLRQALGFTAFLLGAAALTAINHHPTTGRHTERERAAVEAAVAQFTHQRIADAWTQAKLTDAQALLAIERAVPLPTRTVQEVGSGIVFTFDGHADTCIDFLTEPNGRAVTARRC
jgi:hypothetical protein